MTALFDTPPIIVTAVTDTGARSVQFWGDTKLGTITYKSCLVSMSDDTRGNGLFNVQGRCPDEWLEQAWAIYRAFRQGVMPEPTHTVTFTFGEPTFTEVKK